MIEQGERRVPVPVAAAVSVLLLANAGPVGRAMLTGGPLTVSGLIAPVLVVALAYGLWRGSGRARFWTTVLSTGSAGYGVITFRGVDALRLLPVVAAPIIVGLLLLPAASRRWFKDAR